MTTPAETTTTPASELKPKTKLTGKVVKTTLAGALLDIGMDIPGIVHISQMSETAVKRVEDVLQVGQEVPVWVRKAKTDPEPLPDGHPLRTHPNAIVTPHIAFYSEEAQLELQRRAADEVRRALAGEPPRSPVNSAALAARQDR